MASKVSNLETSADNDSPSHVRIQESNANLVTTERYKSRDTISFVN